MDGCTRPLVCNRLALPFHRLASPLFPKLQLHIPRASLRDRDKPFCPLQQMPLQRISSTKQEEEEEKKEEKEQEEAEREEKEEREEEEEEEVVVVKKE